MANSTIKAPQNAVTLFNEIVDVSSDTTITLYQGFDGFSSLYIILNTVITNPSSSRLGVFIPVQSLGNNAQWSVGNGTVRIGGSEGEIRFLSQSVGSALYVARVIGIL